MINLRSILTAAAFAAAVFTSTAASPLALFPFELPQAQPAGGHRLRSGRRGQEATELPAKFKRQVVSYATNEAPGTVVIDTPNTFLYLVLGNGRALRYGIGVGREGLHLGRHQDGREEGRVAGLASAAGDDRAPALPAALHGRRPRKPAWRPRHVPVRLDLPHPRHQRAADHRPARVFGLHPPDQRGCHRPLPARQRRRQVVVLPMNGPRVSNRGGFSAN